ncbi:MAG: AraC family transcriptional regulator [Alistipes sp.]|nr:AraC family transcriptional regulator [Alistipes sp.]
MKNLIEQLAIGSLPNDFITVDEDLALIPVTSENYRNRREEPTRLSHALIAVATAGHCNIKVNIKEYEFEAPMLLTLMPGQIVEFGEASINFEGYAIALSKRFIDIVNLPGWQQQYMNIYNNPVRELSPEVQGAMKVFFSILYHAAEDSENPFRLQVIENLIRVFYYGGLSKFHNLKDMQQGQKNSIVERFIELVRQHYREERQIGFYADKLCITPKYLSKLVKENTGRSAGEWIENHVILDARAMLQSSDMTIQQIAASLNFPNQSFFGKYFKRATGLSPKQYRNQK